MVDERLCGEREKGITKRQTKRVFWPKRAERMAEFTQVKIIRCGVHQGGSSCLADDESDLIEFGILNGKRGKSCLFCVCILLWPIVFADVERRWINNASV